MSAGPSSSFASESASESLLTTSQNQSGGDPLASAGFVASLAENRLVEDRPSLTKSSKWVLAGTLFSKPVQLFTNILVARLLGPTSFGVLGLASSLAVTFSLIAGLGLGDATNKYLAEHYQRDRRTGIRLASVIIWTALAFSTVFLFSLWLTRTFWVARLFPPSTSTGLVALCLWLTWGNLIFALLVGIFSGLQRFQDFAILSLLQAMAVALFAVSLSFYGAEGAILAYAVGTFISVVWGIWKLWRTQPDILKWPGISAFRNLKTILNFSAPIWVGAFAFAPFVTFTFVFLARQANGPHELGVFNTANGLRMIVGLVPGAIAVAIAPAILQEGGTHGEKAAYVRLIEKSFSALVFLTLTVLIPSMFLSDLIFTLYGRAYHESSRLFIPLTASASIGAIGALLPTVMLAKNRTWWAFVFGLFKSALMVALTVIWVPRFLATGLTWAVMISEITLYVLVLEFCIHTDALPQRLRLLFYSANAIVLALMMSAIFLPAIVRWSLVIPLTAAVVIYYLRAHGETANWLTSFVPGPLKPRAQRILGAIAA